MALTRAEYRFLEKLDEFQHFIAEIADVMESTKSYVALGNCKSTEQMYEYVGRARAFKAVLDMRGEGVDE